MKCFHNVIWVFFFLGMTWISSIQAQPALEFSLHQARQYALEHNKNLLNANLATHEAQARLHEALANGFPQVNASIDYSNFFGSTVAFGSIPGMEIEFKPTSNLSLSLGQLIFSGPYIVGIQMARLYQDIVDTHLEKTEQDIKAQVSQAYFLVLVAQRSYALTQTNREHMQDLLAKTRAMVLVGIAEDLDYEQLQVQAGLLDNHLRATERQLELAYNMLRLHMGLSAETQLMLTDSLDKWLNNNEVPLAVFSAFSLEKNPDYRLLGVQAEMAEKQINMERAAYLPTVSGFYNYTEKLLKPELDLNPKHVIGLNVSIPVFSSGVRKARLSQARINLQIAQNQQDFVGQSLLLQEKQLRFNLNNAYEQYQSQWSNREVARRVNQNVRNKYQQGMASSLDVTSANTVFLQAEGAYLGAILEVLEAQLALNKLLNTL